jgi:hypothetical protein
MMAAGSAAETRADRERAAFRHYRRTGHRLAIDDAIETKFDPDHDPQDGRFTFGSGGTAGRLQTAARTHRFSPEYLRRLKEELLWARVMEDKRVPHQSDVYPGACSPWMTAPSTSPTAPIRSRPTR